MKCLLVAALCAISPVASADQRADVLACIGTMNTDADWARCRTMIFAPCATDEVGTETHLACLKTEKAAWLQDIETKRAALSERLTAISQGALTDLHAQWVLYVGQKCPAIAQANAETSAEAALVGCEISEAVGIASEFQSCLSGQSTAPYCVLED